MRRILRPARLRYGPGGGSRTISLALSLFYSLDHTHNTHIRTHTHTRTHAHTHSLTYLPLVARRYRDEDDGVLEELERAAEAETLRKQQAEWQLAKAARLAAGEVGAEEEEGEDDADGAGGGNDGASEGFLMELPDRAAIERAILDRKKKEMLAMLAGEGEGAQPETHTPDLVPKSW